MGRRKNEENLRKHGLDFADGHEVFELPMLVAADKREAYGEDRYVALGFLRHMVVGLVFAEHRDDTIRINSIRDMSVNDSENSSRTNWERLERMKDDEIDTSDIPPLDEQFFRNAELRLPEGKVPIVMSVDADVFEWFKSQGAEYQVLMNRALKTYADEHNS